MAKPKKTSCCSPDATVAGAYQVESIITIDERGQMVLPKHTREKAGIRAGDRLALVTWSKEDRVCCISLIKVEELSEMVKGFLGSLAEVERHDE